VKTKTKVAGISISSIAVAAVLASSIFIPGCMGCGSVVPAGKTVIIMDAAGKSTIYKQGVYKVWGRDKAYFVDQKLKSFKETMKILCADDINMDIDVKCVMSFEVTEASIDFIKSKVPSTGISQGDVKGFELSLDQFYQMAVQDIVRGSARNVISPNETDAIRPQRTVLEAEVQKLVLARVKELKYPIKISAVLLSNIDYPLSVKEMRERIKQAKLADQERSALAEAKLAEAKRQVAVEMEEAKVRMIRAQAQADENQILTESLTPQFLMWRQFEVMENLASELGKGPNNTVFMLPYHQMSPEMINTAVIRDSVAQIGEKPKRVVARPEPAAAAPKPAAPPAN
jgi:regulator of protease activity HflC (stomatin/prohibitin superfamily)